MFISVVLSFSPTKGEIPVRLPRRRHCHWAMGPWETAWQVQRTEDRTPDPIFEGMGTWETAWPVQETEDRTSDLSPDAMGRAEVGAAGKEAESVRSHVHGHSLSSGTGEGVDRVSLL